MATYDAFDEGTDANPASTGAPSQPPIWAAFVFLPSLDSTAPTISNLTPAPGAFPGTRAQAKMTPIEFDVEDVSPGLGFVLITVQFADLPQTYVVHDGSNFLYPFDSAISARTGIATKYHYKVWPRNGWESNIDAFHVYAADRTGNLEGGLP